MAHSVRRPVAADLSFVGLADAGLADAALVDGAAGAPGPGGPPFTVGELARRTGVTASALRFYEARGLLHADRTPSGHRRYPRTAARRVAFIVFAQRVGLSLEEVRAALDRLPRDRVPTGADWERLGGAWRARIAERIAELERLRDGLTTCIGCGCLSLGSCTLLNPGDRAGTRGPGPRYWIDGRR